MGNSARARSAPAHLLWAARVPLLWKRPTKEREESGRHPPPHPTTESQGAGALSVPPPWKSCPCQEGLRLAPPPGCTPLGSLQAEAWGQLGEQMAAQTVGGREKVAGQGSGDSPS